MSKLGCIVLAAGDGTRLRSRVPKALHRICGHPMLYHVLKIAKQVGADPVVVVIGYQGELIREALEEDQPDANGIRFAWQTERKGTGHAVLCAQAECADCSGELLVLSGDTPLITEETLRQLVQRHRHQEAAATLLATHMPDPTGYGRLLRYDNNTVQGIVEHRDANRYERAITEINVGTYCFDAAQLWAALAQVKPDNAQGEYYLTDVIRIFVDSQRRVEAVTTEDWKETIGVNHRVQLAEAEGILRNRIRERHMLAGVTLIDPDSTFIDDQVVIGQDTVISPRVDLCGATQLGQECQLGPGCYVESAIVGDNCRLGAHCALIGAELPAGSRLPPYTTLQRNEEVRA